MTSNNSFNPNLFYDPKHPKFDCLFQASGKKFNPVKFLNESKIPDDFVIAKGIIGLPNEIKSEVNKQTDFIEEAFEIFETPFLLLSLSKETKLEKQLKDAVSFLNSFFDDLIKLRDYPNVNDISLQFISEDCSKKNLDSIPKEFFSLTSKCGIKSVTFGGIDEEI